MLRLISCAVVAVLAVGCGGQADDVVETGTYEKEASQVVFSKHGVVKAKFFYAGQEIARGEITDGLLFTEECGVYSVAARDGQAWVEHRADLSKAGAKGKCFTSLELRLSPRNSIKAQSQALAYGMGDVD